VPFTGTRKPPGVAGAWVGDRPQPPQPQQFLELVELLRATSAVNRSGILGQELRMVLLREGTQNLDRIIGITVVDRMSSHRAAPSSSLYGTVRSVSTVDQDSDCLS
jgi:hypothetical protein